MIRSLITFLGIFILAFSGFTQTVQPGVGQSPSMQIEIEALGQIIPREIAASAQWNPRLILLQEQPPIPGPKSDAREENRIRTEEKIRQLRENPEPWLLDTNSLEEAGDDRQGSSPSPKSTVLAGTPQVGTIIEAQGWSPLNPPDNAMAINAGGDIVAIINGRIQMFDEDGNENLNSSTSDWFSFLGPTATVFDPRVEYSQNNNKFVICVMHGSTPTTTKLYLAYSSTSDPMDPWWFYQFDAGSVCAEDVSWWDFPSMGFSDTELFVTGNLFTPCLNAEGETVNCFDQAVLWQLEMMDGFIGASVGGTVWCDVQNNGGGNAFSIVPMSHGFSSYGPEMWFASSNDGDNIQWWKVTGALGTGQVLQSFSADIVNYSGAGSCPQLDENNPLDGGGTRMRDGFVHGGNIYCTHALNNGNGWYGIRAYRINTGSSAVTSSDILDLDGFDYTYPVIEPWGAASGSWDGTCILGLLRTASTIYPQMRAVTLGSDMVFDGSFLLRAGTSAFTSNGTNSDGTPSTLRWGDYTDAHWREGTGHSEVWFYGHVGEANIRQNYVVQVADEFLGCTNSSACNYDPNATVDDGSCETDSCSGCTDAEACNYDSGATIDDDSCTYPGCNSFGACNYSFTAGCDDGSCCFNTCVEMTMGPWYLSPFGGLGDLLSFVIIENLTNDTIESGGNFFSTIYDDCLEAGCYTLSVTGDGDVDWNFSYDPLWIIIGADLTIFSGTGPFEGVFIIGDGGESGGCMDAQACNFEPGALCDNGSCCYDHCVKVEMTDSYGDGWNSNLWEITDLVSGGVVQTGSLMEGEYGEEFACLPDGCYGFSINSDAGLFPYEIGWTLYDGDVELGSGDHLGEASFMVGTDLDCVGCTDPEACNFDQNAIFLDESCCYDNCAELTLEDSYGDGWNGADLTLSGPEGNMGTYTLNSGAFETMEMCLVDGCYHIDVTSGSWPSEISWTLLFTNNYLIGGGAPFSQGFGLNAVFGCMDPLSCDYNAAATCDDGTCTYPGCMDETACNYQSEAVCQGDAICDHSCHGCTYEPAENYELDATQDDGSCIFPAPSDCATDINGDGMVSVSDVLELLGDFGSNCE